LRLTNDYSETIYSALATSCIRNKLNLEERAACLRNSKLFLFKAIHFWRDLFVRLLSEQSPTTKIATQKKQGIIVEKVNFQYFFGGLFENGAP
jgi:hypothetical protein